MPRVLVTGAGGFVGRHLVRLLLQEGHRVFAGTTPAHEPHGGELAGAAWLPLDVCSERSLAAAVDEAEPEWVFHLAAQSSVRESFADPLGTWEVNATGTVRLLHALPPSSRLLFVSSAEVYGPVPEGEQPISEARPLRPLNPYAASKAAAEMAVVQAALEGRVHGVVTRSFNHTGPGQDTRFAIPAFAVQLAAVRLGAAEPVLRVGNLTARRDFLDVRDVARAYLLLVERGAAGEVYNVCSGAAHSMRELVDELLLLSGTGARVETDPERVRPVEVPVLRGDPARLRTLGWEPRIPLRRTLAELLDAAEREAAAHTGAPS